MCGAHSGQIIDVRALCLRFVDGLDYLLLRSVCVFDVAQLLTETLQMVVQFPIFSFPHSGGVRSAVASSPIRAYRTKQILRLYTSLSLSFTSACLADGK
jgi:hypothetical protein